MNEVKIYKLSPDGFDEVSEDQVNYDFDDDLFLVDLADFQSERAARIAAETKLAKLAELEDTLKAKLEDCENSIDSLQREPSKLEAYKILKSRRNLYEEIIELVEKARSKS